MLCALGTVVFAAAATRRWDRAAMAAGFATAALLTNGSDLPDAAWTGGLAAAGAALLLSFGSFGSFAKFSTARTIGFLVGGALAGWWATLLEVQALPFFVALPVVGGIVLLTMRLSRTRPSFAPGVLQEEGVLAIMVLALVVAVMPGVMDGWQAATNLSGAQERPADPVAIPLWTLVLIFASTTLGGVYSMWSRR
jgi:hypothetical protein